MNVLITSVGTATSVNLIKELKKRNHYIVGVDINDYGYTAGSLMVDNYIKVPSCSWFTNLDIKKRHEDLILYRNYNEKDYPKYDNYDAINVDKVSEIPCDYDGVMGVPITFLDKFNPSQFEIVLFPNRWQMSGHDRTTINGNLTYARLFIKKIA